MNDINDLTTLSDAPVEIQIKLREKGTISFHCGKTELTENEKRRGWCATKLDAKGISTLYPFLTSFYTLNVDKIERWGFCQPKCTEKRDSLRFTNLNLLTDRECNTLFSQVSIFLSKLSLKVF